MDAERQDVFKTAELSSRILSIIEMMQAGANEELTQSDLQGAVESVILQAIRYGRTGK